MVEPKLSNEKPGPRMPLLLTKLFIPRTHPDLVARPWLLERLNEGLRRNLTLVCAPAGYGKTTLLSTWVGGTCRPCAWLSLDERDNDPARFWSYFIGALQTLFPETGSTTLAMLLSPQPPPLEYALSELLNEITRLPEDFLFVMDDFHTVEDEQVIAGLTFLLENIPPRLHLVVSSRVDPPFPLHLLRGRRQLLEVRLEELRFRREEIATFINQMMGLDLSPADIAKLEKLSEGWVAGLQLAALSIQGSQDVSRFLDSFSGSDRFVFDYLAQEVLDRQAEEVQAFLLATSILERLCAPLCDALLADAPHLNSWAILDYLEKSNLFLVPLDHQRQWYRYHHLFGSFLHARLEHEAAQDAIIELHQRASRWYKRQDFPHEAVHHALAARDYQFAVDLIQEIAMQLFAQSELITLLGWLAELPDEIVAGNARLNAIYAWALTATSRFGEVEPHLANIERLLGAEADGSAASLLLPPEVRGGLGEVSTLRAVQAFNQFDIPRIMQLTQQARDYLKDDVRSGLYNSREDLLSAANFNLALAREFSGDVKGATQAFQETLPLIQENLHLLPMAYSHLAQLLVIQGRLQQARSLYDQAFQASKVFDRPSPYTGLLHSGLGNLLYEWNDLDQAFSHLEQGIRLGRQWNHWEILLAGYSGLIRIKIARRDLQGARDSLDELARLVSRLQVVQVQPAVDAYNALLAIYTGDVRGAAAWAEAFQASSSEVSPTIHQEGNLLLARVLLAAGEGKKALLFSRKWLDEARAAQRWGQVVALMVLQSMALAATGEKSPAVDVLRQALSLAQPEGYRRVFLDGGEPVRQLLEAASLPSMDAELVTYSRSLLDDFKNERRSPAEQPPFLLADRLPASWGILLPEPLSERELQVLRLLAAGHSNPEIASQLYISLNTVKSHLKNIYAKLGVTRRGQATARARDLKLL